MERVLVNFSKLNNSHGELSAGAESSILQLHAVRRAEKEMNE